MAWCHMCHCAIENIHTHWSNCDMVSGRKKIAPPEGAKIITNWNQLNAYVEGFASGGCSLLVIISPPGLSKSHNLEQVAEETDSLIVRGRHSPISFFCSLFHFQDRPVIIDDADSVMGDKLCREYIKLLTETKKVKTLRWETSTTKLDDRGVPDCFETSSPVCIATNSWSDSDPIYQAIASRAHLVWFLPPWAETYQYLAMWFWDQEILDYIYDRLDVLTKPDLRIAVKASELKEMGLPFAPWQEVIDDHCDDDSGIKIRELIDAKEFSSDSKRWEAFNVWQVATFGKDADETISKRTFHRRIKGIRNYRPARKVKRLKVKKNAVPA